MTDSFQPILQFDAAARAVTRRTQDFDPEAAEARLASLGLEGRESRA